MLKSLRFITFALICASVGFFIRIVIRSNQIELNRRESTVMPILPPNNISAYPKNIFKGGNGIFFLETTDRMEPPSLVLCAIESAARVYHDRPIGFFMKGLHDIETEEDMNRTRNLFPTLSSFHNVHILPLRFEELFNNTPLQSWYEKINPQQETHWIHVSSDACRLALVWKYGGIYMDTDIISIRSLPSLDFLAAESSRYSSSGIFRFSSHHNFIQKCMEDFVKNYNSKIWGQQGPHLFTRILKKSCDLPNFSGTEDVMCGNITFFNPKRFYPIPYTSWRTYYHVWNKLPTFNDSYALHLWNFMNHANIKMVPGSNMLAEHLYKGYCPSTYGAVLRNVRTYH